MTPRAAFPGTITGPRRWRRRPSTRRPTAASRSASRSAWLGGRSSVRKRPSLLLALLIAAAPAAGQQHEPTPYERAIAAGYKALTLCSGIFNAGRSQAQVEVLELNGIYPEYDEIVPTLRAEVHAYPAQVRTGQSRPAVEAGEVRVPFDESLPPRIARWSLNDGCTILPIGDSGGARGRVLHNAGAPFAGSMDGRPWPIGDLEATAATQPLELAAAIARAFDASSYGSGRTTGVVIVQSGRIVGEHYA